MPPRPNSNRVPSRPDTPVRPSPLSAFRIQHSAFTLVELLVVLGIIGLLAALLMPAIASARRASNATLCASNLRQLATSLIHYAQDFDGAFPPNSGEIQQYWYSPNTIGRYINSTRPDAGQAVVGGVMVCPNDTPDALRSYSVNVFSSSFVSSYVRNELESSRPPGKLFKFGTKRSSDLILLADAWSDLAFPENVNPTLGFTAQAVMGFTGTPGRRFGAGGGVGWSIGRFGTRDSQVAFYRHRAQPNRSITDPDGAANFAFADGHVALLASKDLADFETGKSRYRALWSEIDPEID